MSNRAPRYAARDNRIPYLIRDRMRFTTSNGGALRADKLPEGGLGPHAYGELAGEDLTVFKRDCYAIDYVVYSYATPIAWHTPDGGWHRVTQRFSPATSRHQSALYLIR